MGKVLAFLALLAAFAFGGKKFAGPGGGGGGGTRRARPGGGWEWGDPNTPLPDGCCDRPNFFYIAPDCSLVLEGPAFEPASGGAKSINAVEEPTLAETLAVAPDNSVYGFVDYLINVRGYTEASAIAEEIIIATAPQCADAPHDQRAEPIRAWAEDFIARIELYVAESVGGIPSSAGGGFG